MLEDTHAVTGSTSESMPSATGRGSRLGRLFLYSKDSKITAQENFTT